jgi:hypothetical protein
MDDMWRQALFFAFVLTKLTANLKITIQMHVYVLTPAFRGACITQICFNAGLDENC